ncbi:MAG: hypothetical protein HOW71_11695 [Nonomuraea sp.]|nr:hypothetical protein [Nonomuraea sp.]
MLGEDHPDTLISRNNLALAYFAGREQEVHPPEPEHLAHDRPGVAVGGLDESRGDPLPTHPLDPYGVEVDPGETEPVTGAG